MDLRKTIIITFVFWVSTLFMDSSLAHDADVKGVTIENYSSVTLNYSMTCSGICNTASGTISPSKTTKTPFYLKKFVNGRRTDVNIYFKTKDKKNLTIATLALKGGKCNTAFYGGCKGGRKYSITFNNSWYQNPKIALVCYTTNYSVQVLKIYDYNSSQAKKCKSYDETFTA